MTYNLRILQTSLDTQEFLLQYLQLPYTTSLMTKCQEETGETKCVPVHTTRLKVNLQGHTQ